MYEFKPTTAADTKAIESLLDRSFGPDRKKRRSYAFREGVEPAEGLSFTAWHGGELVGTIAYWPVAIGEDRVPALLVGPVAVEPRLKGRGIGVTLIRRTLAKARRTGHRIAVLVGDADYYERFGFVAAEPYDIWMPGQNGRFMVKALVAGALDGVHGGLVSWREVRRRVRAA